jgi:hypothetical protein
MFKRANKITALLVAAASVMSIVPAMAADSTTSKLESKDGTITNAVAFQDGKYVYQGYKSDDDTDSVYYNGGSKDKELDDLSDATLNGSYADKYAFANDGSDQYLVDLSSGSVTDDTTPVDDADTAATKLQTKLKKTDRYGDAIGSLTAENNLGASSDDNSNAALPGTKFGDSWYSYKVTTDSSDADNYVANGKELYGFTDASGKYIDASYLANVYAYSSKQGKTVKIEDYSNNIDDVDDDTALLATLVGQPVVLTQDKDYLYALVHVAITDNSGFAKATATTTTAAVNGTATGAITTMRTYVQKIAKAQGDQKDDAYLPKTVESYEVGNSDNEYDCGDAGDAYDVIKTAIGKAPEDLTIDQSDVVSTEDNGTVKPKFTTVSGNLIAIDAADDSIDAATLLFKKDKVKFDTTAPAYKKSGTTLDSDTKVDTYFVEKDSDDSVDVDVTSGDQYGTYDIDVDGNVWVVADGKIYEYASGEMTKKFSTDSSMDSLSVYDENNIIAWENNGDIYTTVAEGKDATDTTVPATTTTTKTGWSQLADGTWNFFDATGTKVVSNWVNAGGVWYYLKADGVMATGWLNDNGTWYYLNASGAMQTGWLNDNGTWYYLNASGAMLANTTVDGYTLNASGAWVK